MSDLLNQASLVMIPSGYKEDTVYSVVPSDGSGDLSFTRASNGTRVNSAGLVEVCPWNLLQYSEDFTNAVYSKFNSITATADQTTAPNGTTTADKIGLSTASTTFPNLAQDAQYIGGQVYIFTVYLKKNTVNFGKIRVGGTAFASSTNSPLFNLNTGVVVSGTGTIESVGNGWYRCSMTATADTSAAGGFAIDLPDSAGVWSGASVYNVNDSIFAWGFMSNIGATAKPYFPTTDRLNVPRLTYQNGGGGCPSLLLEKQSTNYFPYSQNVSQWYEPDDGITLSQNTTDTTSPDGTNNAAKITIVGGNQRNYQITNSVAGTGTFSAYVKAGTSSTLALYTSSASLLIGYNLSTLAVTQTTGTGTITSVGNGWYRITATNTLGASEVLQVLYTGNANETIYIWGFQVEDSSYATSYIPTTSSSATRVADACFKTGISSLIGQTEGVLFVDFVKSQDGYNYYNLSDGTNNNRIFIGQDADAPNRLRAYVRENGNTASVDINVGPVANGRYKMAIGYKLNDVVFYINGTLSGTDTSTAMPVGLSDFSLTNTTGGSASVTTNTNQVALFKTRLTNAELASLTTL